MRRTWMLGSVLLAALAGLAVRPAHAQLAASLADDLVILTNRLRGKEAERTHQHLGPGPGSMETLFPEQPGGPRPLPSEPSRASTPGQANITPPPPLTPAPMPTPLYGVLEIPAIADEGPPNGLSLDQAIEILVQANPDLQTRARELSKAQADIVSAGLRSNPFIFGDVGNAPYQNYSPQRPGAVNYEITIIQPWDFNQKRKTRIRVAQSARSVVECLYQDAVRVEIDNLYTAFLDVLQAREAVRQQQIGLEGMEQLVKATRALARAGEAQLEVQRVEYQRNMAFIAVQDAQSALRQAKQLLARQLNLPPAQADGLELRGAIGGFDLELPPLEQLLKIAMEVRPDLNAYRLGVQRAKTEVQMARADRWADAFLLYTPWSLTDNSPQHLQNVTSWSFGALMTLPVFNRNQGNISRAQFVVTQTIIELQGREQQVITDVRRAYEDYTNARNAVKYFNDNVLPLARRVHDGKLRRLTVSGTEGLVAYLDARREYNDVVRRYLEATVRLRRASLRLNTAVGQRIVP
jgi:cobalt-zinc-cadmium efflux system outer membrane protein